MTYPNKPSSVNASIEIPRTLEQLDKLGLGTAVPDVRALVARARVLTNAAATARPNYEAQRVEVLRSLVDGTIEPDAAAAAVVDLDRLGAMHGAGITALHDASKMCFVRASAALDAYGDTLLTDVLGPIANKTIADATRAIAKLPEWCDNDVAAVRADKTVRDAWSVLVASADRWAALRRLAEQLRTDGYLKVPASAVDAAPDRFELMHPERAYRFDPRKRPAEADILRGDIAGGAEPALRTGADVSADIEAEQLEHDREAQRQRATLVKGGAYSSPSRARAVAREVADDIARDDQRAAAAAAFDGPDAA